jgi:hypothetical protein
MNKRRSISSMVVAFFAMISTPAIAAMNHDEAEEVARHFESVFGTPVAIKWDANTTNATPIISLKTFDWIIQVDGGMAASASISRDVFELILCHELGHIKGGEPFLEGTAQSVEGQADFYASSVCLKRLWAEEGIPAEIDASIVSTLTQKLTESCENAYRIQNEISLCVRSSEAAMAFVQWLGYSEVGFFTPSPERATVTRTKFVFHPGGQCRLDTLFAGAHGLERPRCWFAPPNAPK